MTPEIVINGGPRRVYLDPLCEVFCLVSEGDYAWAIQWRWQYTWDRHKRIRYATRSTHDGPRRIKIYMHKAILIRKGDVPATPAHKIGDHGDSDSLNNQRDNLAYMTASQNRLKARVPR